tara:strand:+ start:15226 stop:15675 length:450 start_codon:yes stop_codon:yes gene_type:complete
MTQASIDHLAPKRSLIDLAGHDKREFDIGDDYKLSFVYDDIILVEFVDTGDEGAGDVIERGGIFVPTNSLTKAWRKAKVILAGPQCAYTKVGDIVMFPNDKGASVANMEIDGYGKVKDGMFLNEQRLFGICVKKGDKKITRKKNKNASS